MLGFLLGAVVAVGMMKAARHGLGPFARFGHAFGRGGFGSFGGCARAHHRSGSRFGGASAWSRRGLRFVFYRLRTSPGQEGAITDSLDALRAEAEKLREGARDGRAELAKVMRESSLSPEKVKAAVARQEQQLDALRETLVREVVKVHGVLDERQRARAADLIEGRWHDEDERDW